MSNLAISYLFIIIGAGLLVCGVFLFFRQRAIIAECLQTDGVVIELLQRRKKGEYVLSKTGGGLKRKYLYRPRVQFKTQAGKTVVFTTRVALRPAPYSIGQQVRVLYDPHNPHQAQINRPLYLWFYVGMLIFFGLFMAGMGLIGIIL